MNFCKTGSFINKSNWKYFRYLPIYSCTTLLQLCIIRV